MRTETLVKTRRKKITALDSLSCTEIKVMNDVLGVTQRGNSKTSMVCCNRKVVRLFYYDLVPLCQYVFSACNTVTLVVLHFALCFVLMD